MDATANLKVAARRIAFGKWLNVGQTCVAPDYLLVDTRVHDELLGLIKEEARRMFGEHPLDNEDYGHIVNAKHFARVRGLIDPDKVVLEVPRARLRSRSSRRFWTACPPMTP